MNCPSCGARLENDCRFCVNCGTPITVADQPSQGFCVQCGNKLSVGSSFCEICGTPVVSAGPAGPAGPAGVTGASGAVAPVDGSASASTTSVMDAVSGDDPLVAVQGYGAVRGASPSGSASGSGQTVRPASGSGNAGNQGLGAGAIVGIVVGALAVVAIVALGVAFAMGAFDAGDSKNEAESTTTEQTQDSESTSSETDSTEQTQSNEIAVKAKLSEYSWSDLAKIADKIETEAKTRDEAIKIAATYNLVKADGTMTGDTKTLETGTGSTDIFIADVYVDKLASSTSKCAAFTFIGADILTTHAMNATATNSGGWSKSGMRSWLNGTVVNSFPADLEKATKQVVKMTNNTGKSQSTTCVTQTTDKVWLLSWMECLGPISWNEGADTSYIDNIDNQEGVQYAWFKQQGVEGEQGHDALIRSARGSSEEGVWWMRSSAPNTSTSFGDMGPEIDNGGTASTAEGVVIGFCI